MIPRKIGVFDSGVGGLSVLKSIISSQHFETIVYYGDTARVPYGTRSKEVITQYSLEALEFFNTHDMDLLIVACNTISAYALKQMQQNANYPIIGVIEPGVLALTNKIKNKDSKILILGTKATINSNIYATLLQDKGYSNIQSLQTSLFVPMVEEGIFSGEVLNSTIKYYFNNINIPDAIILGCTHFPLISKEISNFFNNKPILIHSGESIVEYLQAKYKLQRFDTTNIEFYASDSLDKLKATANIWLNQ